MRKKAFVVSYLEVNDQLHTQGSRGFRCYENGNARKTDLDEEAVPIYGI